MSRSSGPPHDGQLEFVRAIEPTPSTLLRMVEKILRKVLGLLGRLGLLCTETGHPDPECETEAPAMAELYDASVRQVLTTGSRKGQKPLRLRPAASVPQGNKTGKRRGPRQAGGLLGAMRSARAGGFDLYATRAIH